MNNQDIVERLDEWIQLNTDFTLTYEQTDKLRVLFHEALTTQPAHEPDMVMVPRGVLDLLRFMCATWTDIDTWAYSDRDLTQYPVVQGTRQQLNLKKIGSQEFDKSAISSGVDFMLTANDAGEG